MALKLRFDLQAANDLVEISTYLVEEAGAGIADRVRQHLRKRIEHLRRFPQIGTRTTDANVRILPALRYPYRIYYTVSEGAVVILHIRHTARREPDHLPKRLG